MRGTKSSREISPGRAAAAAVLAGLILFGLTVAFQHGRLAANVIEAVIFTIFFGMFMWFLVWRPRS